MTGENKVKQEDTYLFFCDLDHLESSYLFGLLTLTNITVLYTCEEDQVQKQIKANFFRDRDTYKHMVIYSPTTQKSRERENASNVKPETLTPAATLYSACFCSRGNRSYMLVFKNNNN